jgi:pyrimidine operon attenuation protein/uracil phosphoribosyltransferase
MDAKDMEHSMKRIALEIVEKNKGLQNVHLVGIQTRGVPMADRIARFLREIEAAEINVGTLDITLYRDDLSLVAEKPMMKGSDIDFEVENSSIILVDDVLFTGRTVRAAIDAILDIGRPANIQLCVLIDRGHQEMPVKANYVGRNVPTSINEVIKVTFEDTDEDEMVRIMEK